MNVWEVSQTLPQYTIQLNRHTSSTKGQESIREEGTLTHMALILPTS